MTWVEEGSSVKFFDFGEYKPGHTDKDAFLLKKGEAVEADVIRIDTVEKNDKDGNKTNDYKFRVKVDGVEEEIILWANTAMKRQQESLQIVEGEHIRIHYVDDYSTDFGSKGRNVKLAVDRNEGKKK